MNSSGPISLAGCTAGQSISKELSLSGTAQISLNCTNVRTLAGVPSGAIIMPTNFYGKSNFPGNYYFTYYYLTVTNVNGPSFYSFPYTNLSFVDSSSNLYLLQQAGYPQGGGVNNQTLFTKVNNTGSFAYSKYYYQYTSIGGAQNAQPRAVTVDSSGNIYTGLTSSNSFYAVFSKLTSSFSTTWSTSFSAIQLTPTAMLVDGSGNLYATGTTNATSPTGAYLLQLNSSGTVNYFTFFAIGSIALSGTSLFLDGSGNVIVGAYETTSSNYYGYIASYTTSGSFNSLYRAAFFRIYKMAYISSSAIYIASSGSGSAGSATTATITKLSSLSTPTVAWSYTLTALYNVVLICADFDSSGNAYLLVDTGSSGWNQLAVVKIDTSGSLIWTRYIYSQVSGYINNSLTYKIKVSPNGIFISGYIFDNEQSGKTTNQNYAPSFTMRVPLDGTGAGSYQLYYTTLMYSSVPIDSSGTISLTSRTVTWTSVTPTTASQTLSTQTVTNIIACGAVGSSASNICSAISGGYGSQTYTGGTYSWIAPTGVTSVSVVMVGAGGAGINGFGGGGGGALAYLNNYSVTPGNSYSVSAGICGGNSYFINSSTVGASGGASANSGGTGGTKFGSLGAGYSGGYGGNNSSNGKYGGGAGGYAGVGGGASSRITPGQAGSGGGGGAGGGVGCGVGGGGGVQLFGQGSSGSAVCYAVGGNGGSGGRNGGNGFIYCCCGSLQYASGPGGNFGGGGGGYGCAASGSYGAIRIVWPGSSRTFPSTNVGNV